MRLLGACIWGRPRTHAIDDDIDDPPCPTAAELSKPCASAPAPPSSTFYRNMYQNLQSADEAQRLEALRQQKAMRNDLMFQSAPDFRRPTEKDTEVKDAEAENIIRELETSRRTLWCV